MARLISASLAVALTVSVATVNATTTIVDFVGTTSFFGPALLAPSGGLAPLPATYNPIAGANAGETIVGWFSFENNPALYSSTQFTTNYNAGATPVLTGFEINFPSYDFTISRTNIGSLIPGVSPAIEQKVWVRNSSFDLIRVDNRWDNRIGGGNLQGIASFSAKDNSATALVSTDLPAAINLADFDEITLLFNDFRYSGFNASQSLRIEANLNSPSIPAAIGLESNAFHAFGGFEATSSSGGIVGWQPSATGTVDILDIGAGNSVARLTTGSPVSISQSIATPDSAFEILFDYQFLTTSGSLDVLINDMLLGSISAPGSPSGALETYTLLVSDPVFRNLTGAELKFLLTDATFAQVYIDNVQAQSVKAVPIPAALWLLGSALFGLVFVGRRKQAVC